MREQLKQTFEINHDVFLVQGANRSAIYDTNLGNVYSVNKAASEIILNRRVETDFYSQLKQSGLTGEQITKFTPEKPECGLEFMWLVLTPKCNLRCIHCYEESTPNQQAKLTLPAWKKIIEQGSQIGCKRTQFIGGEPLVYPGTFELMEHARNLGFEFVEIFTNGTLLTPEKISRLKDLDIHVAVSLYSNFPLVHDQVTTVPGSFEKTLRALRLLKEKDIPTRIGVIIMRQNQESVESTLELIENLGFDAEDSLDVVRPFGRGKSKDLIPSDPSPVN